MAKSDEHQALRQQIKEFIHGKIESNSFIDSAHSVVKMLSIDHNISVDVRLVREVMTSDMQMSFRKVVDISPFENSVKNLVLRQLAAMKIIDFAVTKTRVINIDETWLGMEDFRAMKWQAPRSKNSCVRKLWSPRISLLLAMDNFGESYVALS